MMEMIGFIVNSIAWIDGAGNGESIFFLFEMDI
jgi:hypothetical protein